MEHPPVSPRFHIDDTQTIRTFRSDQQHILGNAMYELDTRKSTSYEKSDLEYGITITKVRVVIPTLPRPLADHESKNKLLNFTSGCRNTTRPKPNTTPYFIRCAIEVLRSAFIDICSTELFIPLDILIKSVALLVVFLRIYSST